MGTIPEEFHDLFEKRTFAHVGTVLPDGAPHVTPVWVDHENREYVLVNTARGRRKEKNVRQNPKVGLSVCDPEDPYRYVSVRGEAELTEDGAKDHIDSLAQRYFDQAVYPHHGEESGARVLIKIPTENIVTSG